MGETYYDVLGVDSDASAEEIRAAYRERVLETHPDHNDAPDAAEQFKRVSTAESVLTDGTERARYDRLGHDAYVRLAEQSVGGGGGGTGAETDETADSSESAERNSSGGATADANATDAGSTSTRTGSTSAGMGSTNVGASATNAGTRTGRRRAGDRSTDSRGTASNRARTESHHARQRKRRRQQRARQRATSGWALGAESSASGDATNRDGSTATASATAAAGVDLGPEADASDAGFRYAVHDWTDDVDLEWEGQPLAYSTAVTLGCCWLLYPILVASSLTTAFPVVVNLIVAACTLGVVGYALTRPRIAAVLFGSWSMLFPLGIDWLGVSPVSLTGLVALGFAWVPFGYALALWWALRP